MGINSKLSSVLCITKSQKQKSVVFIPRNIIPFVCKLWIPKIFILFVFFLNIFIIIRELG